MGSYHEIENICIANGILSLVVDGQAIHRSLAELSPLLATASELEIGKYEISPSGYGIHWPLLDEDISIDGLLGVVHSSAHWKQTA